MFKKLVEKYTIVEVPQPKPQPPDPEAAKSMLTLAEHPGFLYLVNKLKLQRHLLESKLKNDRHAKLGDVEFLQSGIFWTNWLEQQVNEQVYQARAPKAVPATNYEEELFRKVQDQLEVVGA